ncbi:hypothetical protein RFI_27726 [Reticulomyxa filosa]|uniref:Calcineurin-like phosphoesterase domain-containing protein n=1 Tax=Reticulomyxa filosa TaxID=46433 RepID=X6M7L6_RETFI|nr:hypothetical protein RFI_27726 [Reticulomyxa filosa]|eukprot:ETO09651.1 hypothetical protein RFI_27726 [Reticulomyxa filosa]
MENMLRAFSEFIPNKDSKYCKITGANVPLESGPENTKSEEKSRSSQQWTKPSYPYFHNLIGNHEMYNFDRRKLMEYMYSPKSNPLEYYYSLSPYPGFVFIFLDSYVVSIQGYDYITTNQNNSISESNAENKDDSADGNHEDFIQESKKLYTTAKELLEKHNQNKDKNSASEMTGEVRRFVAYNGGFGEKQLQWFAGELEKCKKNKDNVFVFAHLPLSCTKGDEDILSWEFDKIRSIIDQYHPIVKVVFAGHDHVGEMTVVNDVKYRTLQGAVESDIDKDCFATAYFYQDKLFLKGYGIIPNELFDALKYYVKHLLSFKYFFLIRRTELILNIFVFVILLIRVESIQFIIPNRNSFVVVILLQEIQTKGQFCEGLQSTKT